jgi:hypothetical protein
MYLKNILNRLAIRLKLIPPQLFELKFVDEHPSNKVLKPKTIYVVCNKHQKKWAIFRCPGAETEIIKLSLSRKRRPRWSISSDFFGRPTIHPSVRLTEEPFAHFWITKGDVSWCSDSGRKPTRFTYI